MAAAAAFLEIEVEQDGIYALRLPPDAVYAVFIPGRIVVEVYSLPEKSSWSEAVFQIAVENGPGIGCG